jgi:hypothetical protein
LIETPFCRGNERTDDSTFPPTAAAAELTTAKPQQTFSKYQVNLNGNLVTFEKT